MGPSSIWIMATLMMMILTTRKTLRRMMEMMMAMMMVMRVRIFRLNEVDEVAVRCRPSEGANYVFFLCELSFKFLTINPFLCWALLNEFFSVSACHFVFCL